MGGDRIIYHLLNITSLAIRTYPTTQMYKLMFMARQYVSKVNNFLTNSSFQCLVVLQVLGVQVPLVPGPSCPTSASAVALILFWVVPLLNTKPMDLPKYTVFSYLNSK